MIDETKKDSVIGHISEERKREEIEHSRIRRSILQGFERLSDTAKSGEPCRPERYIHDKKAFKRNFSNMKFYSVTHESSACQYKWLMEKCKPGMLTLDFCCGNGENGIYAAQCGAEAVGIDISPEGIKNARLNAAEIGVQSRCKFEVMDGERMIFKDNTFDLGVEYGALHHVDLDKAMAELRRVLKPGTEMICVEALRHNPFIRWYRKVTPHLRTRWEVEHILGVEDIDTVKKYFELVDIKFFHLAVLFAVPFRKTRLFKPLRIFLDKIDSFLLRNKFLGKYAWIMIFIIRNNKEC